jgi:muramidase (phage lysozyme)
MMQAGARDQSRVMAGLSRWYEQRKRRGAPRGGKGYKSNAVADTLRFLGKPEAAVWIDRFFSKYDPDAAKMERKVAQVSRNRGDSGSSGGGGGGVSEARISGYLKGIDVHLKVLANAVDNVREDVTDIKQLLSPKIITARGYKEKEDDELYGDWRDFDLTGKKKEDEHRGNVRNERGFIQYNKRDPLESVQIQYDPLAPEGNQFRIITKSGKLGKKPNKGFMNSAIKEAAKLTAKLALKEDRKERGEVKKVKTDPKEIDPLPNKKLDPISQLREEMSKRLDKNWKMMKEFKAAAGGDGIMSIFNPAKTGMYVLVGALGLLLGWELGVWLRHKFEFLTTNMLDFLGKVTGTDYESAEAEAQKKRIDKAYRTGVINRGENGEVISEPATKGPIARPTKMGELRNKETAELGGLRELIAKGEGTTDRRAKKSGYESGYDVPLEYGAYNKPTEKPLSKMTLAEVRELQSEMLNNPRNTQKSSAVGRYQIVRTTLFGPKGNHTPKFPKGGLVGLMKLKDTDVFSPELQDRMANYLITNEAHYNDFKKGLISTEDFQKGLASQWDSFEDPDTHMTGSRHDPTIKSPEIQSVISNIGKNIDQQSRKLQNNKSQPESGSPTVVAPVINQTTQNNTMNQRPITSASAISRDPSFIRSASRDVLHPINVVV